MEKYFEPMLTLSKSRKFWIAVAGAGVTYLVSKYGNTSEITLLTGLLTAAGVYGVTNEGK